MVVVSGNAVGFELLRLLETVGIYNIGEKGSFRYLLIFILRCKFGLNGSRFAYGWILNSLRVSGSRSIEAFGSNTSLRVIL